METHLIDLIARVESGNDNAFWDLVRSLREGGGASVEDLIELARSPKDTLRRAAVAGSQGRTEPALLEVIAGLVTDSEVSVRLALAEALKETPAWPLEQTVERLLHDDDPDVRLAAVEAARWRPNLEGTLVSLLSQDDSWRIRQAIAWALTTAKPDAALPALIARLAEDGDGDVQKACAAAVEKHLTNLNGYPANLARPPASQLQAAQGRVKSLTGGSYPRLSAWLDERVAREMDIEPLKAFGTVLTAEADAGRLPRAYHVDQVCDAVRKVLTGEPPRAAVLLGESGVGKTAVVNELAHRLIGDPAGPWHILRVLPGEFLTGTTYIGEWETKLRNLLKEITAPRKVILYVPNLQELAGVGTTSKSDLNVATMLQPYIERGDVTILGESTPEQFRTGLGAILSLRRLFHAVEMTPATSDMTRSILQKVRDEGAADLPDPVLDRLIDLGDYYLAGMAQPGRSVGLLRRVLSATAGKTGPIGERDILTTMSTSTGIPVDFLDDAVPMDRAQIKSFFEARVMGQGEAVDTVVDLVTLIKAGLTDPNKPFGVLLFVGPTGVGKTELARSLAELLFGDPGRMIRIDMSEFATWDAYERLIGRGTMPGLLTSPVREKPFSVVLLDEIEKANMNVFDLCLQVFDAGRLTDSQGRVADFRRTIIIITSNIGSASARPAPVGFGRKAQPVLDREALMKELGRFFRPEFLNRIDRIVHFMPLAEETAVKIAQREVSRVLERSGIARRKLAIDVEPGVFPLLLREGYSITFGARPLKRTVERMVLLPVAQVIAAGRVPPGSMLRLVASGNKVNVQVDAAETAEPAPRKKARAQAVPLAERVAALVKQVEEMRKQAEPLASRKSELLTSSSRPNFWDDRVAAQGVYDEVYRIDGIFKLLDELEAGVHDEAEAPKAKRPSERDLARMEDRVELLESQARHVGFLVGCRDVRELSDALVSLTLVASHGAGLEAVEQLAKMYMGLAARRGLEAEVLDDRHGGTPAEDAITLQITGVGAYALLAGESGLHQLTRGKREGKDGRKRPVDRDVVRVEVFPLPADTTPLPAEEVRTETRTLGEIKGRLLQRPRYEVQLLHAPTMVSVRGWADGTKAEAIEALTPVLRARVEAARTAAPTEDTGRPPVVRRYVLGPSPLVRDVRTNRTTGRVEEVLAGGLELFLHPPG